MGVEVFTHIKIQIGDYKKKKKKKKLFDIPPLTHTAVTPTTALSLEEKQLVQSIERINQKLKGIAVYYSYVIIVIISIL